MGVSQKKALMMRAVSLRPTPIFVMITTPGADTPATEAVAAAGARMASPEEFRPVRSEGFKPPGDNIPM